MILQSLHALYARLVDDPEYEAASPGYSLQKITFKVVLTPEGRLFEIQDAREPDGGRFRPRQVRVLGGTKPSGSGLNPCFLWDNSGYMLGYKTDDEKPERTAVSFEAFRTRHLELESAIRSPVFSAVCRFLESWDPSKAADHSVLLDVATGFGVFQIQGQTAFAHQDPAIDRWWQGQLLGSDAAVEGQCLVTGEYQALARIHDKVRGVMGTQGAGGAIVGFNDDAYTSYGKTQSYNAPIAQDVAFRYVTALNALLDGPRRDKHRITLGDMTVAFWTERRTPTEDIFIQFANQGSAMADDDSVQDEGQRQKLEAFLRAIRQGQEAYADLEDDPEGTPFFLLGLSPNAARIAVRFFFRASLADLVENLRRHHRDIGLVPRPDAGKRREDPEFPAAGMLLSQTARESKDIPPILGAPLLRSIITGTPYPSGLYEGVLRRIQADRRIDYLRCCVIKGYLNRNLNQEVSMSLDLARPDPAYRLGRLFAALEKTQRDALPELNKTIRDSFYSSASATPGSVFPRLLRTYQHHLAKLEGGRRVNREKLVQEILEPLTTFPPHFGLSDQGLFAIGYYHQTCNFYTKHGESDDN